MLKNEIIKLKAGEVYVEIGVNKKTMMLAHRLANKRVDIFGVDEEDDPCIAGTYHLQGKSEDIVWEWFRESEGSMISILVINKDFDRNYELWNEWVKYGGVIFNGEKGIRLAYKT